MKAVGKPNETARMWLVKVVTGVLVVVLILVHLVVNHLVVQGGLMSYAEVVRYLSNPWISLMESCFLVIVVAHALVGARGIILDLDPPARLQKGIDAFLWLLGVSSIVYGIWLLRVVAAQGAA